ncbi:MAG: hypothetical protein AB9Q18_00985 [Candidatus Reddybacter sp.]
MSEQKIKPLAAAVGAAFMVSVALSPVASAASNPFQLSELTSGYEVASKHSEGKCGEGKCGEGKAKAKAEGKCGEAKAKAKAKAKAEGKCGEGKCGEGKAKAEGKCGEGKCGGKS